MQAVARAPRPARTAAMVRAHFAAFDVPAGPLKRSGRDPAPAPGCPWHGRRLDDADPDRIAVTGGSRRALAGPGGSAGLAQG